MKSSSVKRSDNQWDGPLTDRLANIDLPGSYKQCRTDTPDVGVSLFCSETVNEIKYSALRPDRILGKIGSSVPFL